MDDPSSFLFLAFVCIAVLLFYIRRVSNRSREHTEKLIDTASALTERVYTLEQQLKSLTEVTSGLVSKLYDARQASSATEAHPAQTPAVQPPAPVPHPKPVAPPVVPAAAREKIVPVAPPRPAPPPATAQPAHVAPPLKEVGGIPLTPSAPPPGAESCRQRQHRCCAPASTACCRTGAGSHACAI